MVVLLLEGAPSLLAAGLDGVELRKAVLIKNVLHHFGLRNPLMCCRPPSLIFVVRMKRCYGIHRPLTNHSLRSVVPRASEIRKQQYQQRKTKLGGKQTYSKGWKHVQIDQKQEQVAP